MPSSLNTLPKRGRMASAQRSSGTRRIPMHGQCESVPTSATSGKIPTQGVSAAHAHLPQSGLSSLHTRRNERERATATSAERAVRVVRLHPGVVFGKVGMASG